jgi:hypothetical protein
MLKTGYRCGAVGEYTGGDPREASVAWKALNYEYEEMGNDETESLSRFLNIPATSWKEAITEFKRRYGDALGIWLSRSKREARRYREYGDPEPVEYDSKNVIIDLGGDGIFVVLDATLSGQDTGYMDENGQWVYYDWAKLPSKRKKAPRSRSRSGAPAGMGGIR